ncbi:hypothetical protein J3R30DRAFT_3409767 [Lentinula aciculospora]|uniref:Uncharacterized protein n=1 Tax=Lentinula aciculospora TaxID=153920 RepID=A0A9W8ZXY6_9AGAR|nr:hypothetical protein J3R30DRAFT_3409767 [Lentinula aciculospora]
MFTSSTTTTTASGSRSTTTGNTPGGLIAVTSTQPLVLLFLALGLLATISMTILGLRHANYLRAERGVTWGEGGIASDRNIGTSRLDDARPSPTLWDLSICMKSTGLNDVEHDDKTGEVKKRRERGGDATLGASKMFFGLGNDYDNRENKDEFVSTSAFFELRFPPTLNHLPILLPRLHRSRILRPSRQPMFEFSQQEHEEVITGMTMIPRSGTYDAEEGPQVWDREEGRRWRGNAKRSDSDSLDDPGRHRHDTGAFQIAIAIAMPIRKVVDGGPPRMYEFDLGTCTTNAA